MSQEAQSIKSITPWECPHCSKEILITHVFYHPITQSVMTREQVKEAKERMIEGIEEIEFINEAEKAMALKWVNDESTLLGPADVEQLLKTMAMTQIESKKKTNDEKDKKSDEKPSKS